MRQPLALPSIDSCLPPSHPLLPPAAPAGVNLLEVMCHPEVDYTRTVSNDIIEMLQTLGIEAARNALLKELRGGWLLQFLPLLLSCTHVCACCARVRVRAITHCSLADVLPCGPSCPPARLQASSSLTGRTSTTATWRPWWTP